MSERVAVFGAGMSGQAARKLAESLGCEVTLFDEGAGGQVFNDSAAGFDRFVFSPGFAAQHSWRVRAEASGCPCHSEPAYAAMHWTGKLIGITGTNGKTSLTRLLTDALQRAGQSAVAVGNIGRPFADVACSDLNQPATWAVCELSSFQAELPMGLALDGLIWTNFAEDHLDRYPDLEDYFEAKANLLRCVKSTAPVCLGEDVRVRLNDPRWPERQACVRADLLSASVFAEAPQSANFDLALKLWNTLGLPEKALVDAANRLRLDAHRCERVGRLGGVEFWDDSKATNFHAAEAALQRMQLPVFWIGGGAGKGGDLNGFARRIAPKIEAAFLYGAVSEQLRSGFVGTECPSQRFERFEDAVRAAAERASQTSPSVVLMSPGFASFDQFLTYSQRGKSFISIVLGLMDHALTN